MISRTRQFLAAFAALYLAVNTVSAAQVLMTKTYNGHLYHLVGGSNGPFGTAINYTDTKAYADSIGGCVVVVDDSDENMFLYDMFASVQFPGFEPVNSLYIGYTDVELEGTFKWDCDPSVFPPSTFTSWAAGEPNNTHNREDWATIVGASESAHYGPKNWNDVPNIASTGEVGANPSAPFYGIVEVVPEPASITMAICAAATLALAARVSRRRAC